MKTIYVEVEGLSPLLINRFSETSEIPDAVKKSGKKDYGTRRKQAEKTAYFDEDSKKLWVPSSWIIGSLNTIASDYKLPGSRKSLKSVTGGAIVPRAEKIYFLEDYKLKDIEIDSRPVVIQRARIMKHRARLEEWSLGFYLELDESIIPVKDVGQLFNDAGKRAGFGDYRPPKTGSFGRYLVTTFEERALDFKSKSKRKGK